MSNNRLAVTSSPSELHISDANFELEVSAGEMHAEATPSAVVIIACCCCCCA